MHKMPKRALPFLLIMLLAAGSVNAQETTTAAQIHIGDVLQLRFWPDQTLSGEYPVLESGRINIPLIGELVVAGSTLEEVVKVMRGRYQETTQNGVVTGNLVFRISVLGAVQHPGIFPAEVGRTLFDVISAAGGFTPNANLQAIRIVRDGQTVHIDATQVFADGAGALLVPIKSGDRVVVPAAKPPTLTLLRVLNVLQTAALLTTIILQVR